MKTFFKYLGASIAFLLMLGGIIAICFAPAITYVLWGWKDAVGVFFWTTGFGAFVSVMTAMTRKNN